MANIEYFSILSEGRLMKSWKAVQFGTPEEALAASVSLPDRLMIQGQHPLIKSAPFSPGIEVAGIVSAVGNGAPFAVGDRVMTTTAYATGWGGFAEYYLADATRLYEDNTLDRSGRVSYREHSMTPTKTFILQLLCDRSVS